MKEPFPDQPMVTWSATKLHDWLHGSIGRAEKAMQEGQVGEVKYWRGKARQCFDGYKDRGCRWDQGSFGKHLEFQETVSTWLKEHKDKS